MEFNETKIPKFRRFVLQNFPFIEQTFDALTDYQLICKIVEYLNKCITSVNATSEQTEALTNAYNQLEEYVDHYFDDLDVQEEINNKLDAMVEAGTLQEIITTYIQSNVTWMFDTVSDMQNSTNLTNGSYAKTLGKISKEDGLGALYEINTVPSDIAISDSLYAHVINNFGGNNYYDINFSTQRINNTTCYITEIPLNDEDGNLIPFSLKQAQKTVSAYAQDTKSSVTINGPAFCDATHQYGTIISDGEVLADVNMSDVPNCYYYIGISEDRTFKDYRANQNRVQDLLNDGCKQAFLAYWRLIINNQVQDFTEIASELYDDNVVTNPHPRQCIGQKADKTIVILTCDGRTPLDKGLTSSEMASIMQDLGCVNAWNLDGGGSTTTVIKGYKINKSIDNNGLSERIHKYLLTTNREITNSELGNSFSSAGKHINDIYNKLLPIILQSVITQTNGANLNTLTNQSLTLSNNSTNPIINGITSYYVEKNCHPDPLYKDVYGRQMVSMRDSDRFYHRTLVNGTLSKWHPYMGLYYSVWQNVRETTSTENNTYEPLKFGSAFANIPSYITLGTKDANGDFTEFQIECDDYDRFEITFNVTCTASAASLKYVRLEVNNYGIVTTSVQNQVSNQFGNVTISGTGFIDESLKGKNISLKVYGLTGDRWIRPRLSIKQVS